MGSRHLQSGEICCILNKSKTWLLVLFAICQNGSWCAANPLTNSELSTRVFNCKKSEWDITSTACASIGTWNTRLVTDMSSLFAGATTFNLDISGWDTSSVTTMAGMFNGASSFNRDISRWNTRSVQHMQWMFWGASSFNIDISTWDTSSVNSMTAMFRSATSFNQDLSIWKTNAVIFGGLDQMFTGGPKLSLGDVNECVLGQSSCNGDTTCANTDGSFTCACNAGFVDWSEGKTGQSCDRDQCHDGTHDCAATATCTDTEGSFTCACPDGFVDWSVATNGTSCDRDQCLDGTQDCDKQAACTDTEGSFVCSCLPGLTSDDGGLSCEDEDECAAGSHNCDEAHATCTNSDGSFTCTCEPGLRSDDRGVTCAEIPEIEVSFTANLEMSLSVFEEGGKAEYKATVAAVAGETVDKVATEVQEEKNSDETRRRRTRKRGTVKEMMAIDAIKENDAQGTGGQGTRTNTKSPTSPSHLRASSTLLIVVYTTVTVNEDRRVVTSRTLAANLRPSLQQQDISLLSFALATSSPTAPPSSFPPEQDEDNRSLSSVETALIAALAAVVGLALLVAVTVYNVSRRRAKVAADPEKGTKQVDHNHVPPPSEESRHPSGLASCDASPQASAARALPLAPLEAAVLSSPITTLYTPGRDSARASGPASHRDPLPGPDSDAAASGGSVGPDQ